MHETYKIFENYKLYASLFCKYHCSSHKFSILHKKKINCIPCGVPLFKLFSPKKYSLRARDFSSEMIDFLKTFMTMESY